MSLPSGKRQLRFYFDYISHNAYLAWVKLPALAEKFDIQIKPIPVLFAGLLNAHGQLGPAEIPAKARWMIRDVLRKAKQLKIQLNPPASHPFNPLMPLRMTCLPLPAEQLERLIDALFKAIWVDGLDLSAPETGCRIAEQVGLKGDEIINQVASMQVKQKLRVNTASAIDAGVFGVPSILVEQQLFWGFDDYPYLERYLAGEDLLDIGEYRQWLNISASSQRKH